MAWQMFAGRDERNGGFRNIASDRRYPEAYGNTDIVPVTVTEDPDGTYWGWMGAAYAHYTADTEPVMIQGHRGIFDIQFTYGPDPEVERGHGRIVRLTITETEPR